MKYSVLVLAVFAWGCGSDEAGPNKTPEVAIEPWGLPAAGAPLRLARPATQSS